MHIILFNFQLNTSNPPSVLWRVRYCFFNFYTLTRRTYVVGIKYIGHRRNVMQRMAYYARVTIRSV